MDIFGRSLGTYSCLWRTKSSCERPANSRRVDPMKVSLIPLRILKFAEEVNMFALVPVRRVLYFLYPVVFLQAAWQTVAAVGPVRRWDCQIFFSHKVSFLHSPFDIQVESQRPAPDSGTGGDYGHKHTEKENRHDRNND